MRVAGRLLSSWVAGSRGCAVSRCHLANTAVFTALSVTLPCNAAAHPEHPETAQPRDPETK